ncbi:hypothetical protein IW261DRAFT_1603058 [Armillaria novae-zelandiae]|uniref:Uncharacterized protein n=1 Tax=Armillaria novae-zelandiae TaxID=153914 RepID=A0AA39PRP3_9AGAR|nr:hypothetical protein IW261DRAFT_1603058 [Armillaria novae-zelandiae]
MINNNNPELIQTTSSHLAIAIAMAQAVFGLIKSIIALILFWACPSMTPSVPEYPRMAVTATVERQLRSTSRYSTMVAPSLSASFSSSSSTLVETMSECDNAIVGHKKAGPKKHFSPVPGHMKKEMKRLAQTARAEVKPFARRMSSSFQTAFSPMASPFTPSSDAYFPRKASVQLKRVGIIVEEAIVTSQETILVASRKTRKVSVSITKTKTTRKIAKVGKKAKGFFLESIHEVLKS